MRTNPSPTTPSSQRARRRLLPVVIAALLALVASACGDTVGNPDAAAVVNGSAISLDEVQRRFEQVRNDPQLAQSLATDEDGSFKARVQARLLTQMIQAEVFAHAAQELGIEITEADIDAEQEAIVEQVGGQEAFEQIVEENQLTEADVRDQLRDLVVEREVEEALTGQIEVGEADVRAYYEENRSTRYDRVRASHILVPTEEEAQQVIERLEAGEDFAALANSLSQDPGSAEQGGDLGEFTRGRLVPEFEEAAFAAEVGEVVGPVQTEFGWHVIKVTGRSQPSLDEVRDEIRAELTEERKAAVRTEFRQERFRQADVRVNPRLGQWDADTGEVEAVGALGQAEPVEPQVDQIPLTPQDG